MASVTVASQSFMQPMHQCPKVRSRRAASSQGSRSIKSKRSYSLSSIERSLQSQFSSQALHSSRGRSVATAGHSSRAELAPDANIGNVITVEDSETMEKYIAESGDKLVVVDVSTKTCGPCKLIFPKVVKMSEEYPDALFLKINGDVNSDTRGLMRKWGVRSVPNFRFFRNGEQIHSHTGAKEDVLRAHFLTHYSATSNVTA